MKTSTVSRVGSYTDCMAFLEEVRRMYDIESYFLLPINADDKDGPYEITINYQEEEENGS